MNTADTPDNEAHRLASLNNLGVLDTPAEERFDRITRLAQTLLGTPIALISLVDRERVWFKSRQGMPVRSVERKLSLCARTILANGILYIPDTHKDPDSIPPSLVQGPPHIRCYLGTPLKAPGGEKVGTLCVMDTRPREFDGQQLERLRDLASIANTELESTHPRRMQRELADQERRMAQLIELCPGIIHVFKVTSEEQIYHTYCSPQIRNVLGYAPADFVDAPSFWLDRVHPAERQQVQEGLKMIVALGSFSQQYRFLHADGHYRWLEDTYQVVDRGQDRGPEIIGLLVDVSSRKLLERSAKYYQSIVQSSEDAIFSKTTEGIITSWNPAAERLFGYGSAEVLGQPMQMLFPDDRADEELNILSQLAQGNSVDHFEIQRQRKNGAIVDLSLTISPILDNDGLVVGASTIARDITERKKVEKMKNEFISSVSHELRTPLTSIRGALGMIVGKNTHLLPERVLGLLDIANRNSERLSLLIDDILDLEKLESGELQMTFAPLDLVALIHQAMEENSGFAHRHGVELSIVETPDHARVLADSHRLLQVFANLISNAVKYSRQGDTVELSINTIDEGYHVNVRDHGEGIGGEFRQRIFQRFAQADSSDSRRKGGTGLGLSICKSIVEQHGGEINYHSTQGEGSEFFFNLPMLDDQQPDSHNLTPHNSNRGTVP